MATAVLPPRLPTQPFIDWAETQLERMRRDDTLATHTGGGSALDGAVNEILAGRLGITSRTLYRYLRGLDAQSRPTDVFKTRTVEDMLERAGVRLADVYPETEIDVELEPEAYCEPCRDVVTPISGACPWCANTDLKPPTARRGGWKRPDRVATRKLTDTQLRALHRAYVTQGLSVNDLARQVWQQAGYKGYKPCAASIYRGWRKLGLPARDRIEAVRIKCTIHGLASKTAARPGYGTYLRRRHQPDQPRCEGTIKGYPGRGRPCSRPAMFGSTFCISHDPLRELARQAQLVRIRRNQQVKDMLPAAPFAAWLQRMRDQLGSMGKVADLIGMERSQCYRYAAGRDTSDRPKTHVTRELVDRSAARAGTTTEAIYGCAHQAVAA